MNNTLNGKRIFIVEDDVTNMSLYGLLLRSHRAVVFQDYWQRATAEFITRHMPIDAILMDLMLRSGYSGYDIFNQIRAVPELAHIPIIAVSASDSEVEIPKAKAMGFSGYISKPIQLQKFADQVLTCINGEELWLAESYETF